MDRYPSSFAPIIAGCAEATAAAGPEAPVGEVGCVAIAGAPAAIGLSLFAYGCYANYQKEVQGQ